MSSRAVGLGYASACFVAGLLGVAIAFNRGAYAEPGVLCVLLALLVLGFRFGEVVRDREVREGDPVVPIAFLWAGLFCLGFYAWNDTRMLAYAAAGWTWGPRALAAMLVLVASYLPWLGSRRREPEVVRLVRFALLGCCVLLATWDVVRASPAPRIDVWAVQQDGVRALLSGKNPFEVVSVRNTGPNGPPLVPYVYTPTQILLTVPAYLAGDVRYAMAAATVIVGITLRFIARRTGGGRPALVEDGPALLLWLTPKLFFVIEQAWTEPLTLMLLSLTVAAHVAGRRLLTAALLGLAVSAKQQLVWFIPLAPVMLRFDKRQLLLAAGVAAATVIPFLAASPSAFKRAVFDFQRLLPPRDDGLTFSNWSRQRLGFRFPGAVAFVLAAAVEAIAVWRVRRSVAALAFVATVTYIGFFAFNKWAFTNYYFFIAGLAALAAATAGGGVPPDELRPGQVS